MKYNKIYVIILSKLEVFIMEGIIKKENIIFLALVYNWLANSKIELEEWDVSDFLDKVCEYLKWNYQMDVVMDSSLEDEKWDYYNEIIKEMFEFKYKGITGIYELKSLEGVDYIYERQPDELIKAALQEDALACIYVAKDNLEIKTEYKRISGRKGIYASKGSRAQEIVRDSLEKKGCKDIHIGGYPTSAQLEGDTGFYVSYNCQELIEKVNVLARKLEK